MNNEHAKVTEAIGFIHLKAETIRMIRENVNGMAQVVPLAEAAGNRAVSMGAALIPQLHPSSHPGLTLKTWIYPNGIEVKAVVHADQLASIETEALLAVTACLISLFESCRPVDNTIVLSDIRLVRPAH